MLYRGDESVGRLCRCCKIADKFERPELRCHCTISVETNCYLVLAIKSFSDRFQGGSLSDLNIVGGKSGLERDKSCGRAARASSYNCANG